MQNDLKGIVSIRCDYPGGNVKVHSITPGCAQVDADLRDTMTNWFYWNFEVEALEPGNVSFCFPVNRWMISRQGPAVSRDGGRSWEWLGRENVRFHGSEDPEQPCDCFDWEFTRAGEKVRFAQGIPYLLQDFEDFYSTVASSPYLTRSVLTKTRQGREVPLLVIGSGAQNMLITARHHCCEAMASHALEGFLAEVLSDSPAAEEFRRKYTLYAIPFMDMDGAENGDQGKNRAPHDHNRDYGLAAPIYPENKALMALDREKKFTLCLDFHDPAVRYDAHELLYFGGFSTPSNRANTRELKAWLDEELPVEINPIVYRYPDHDTAPAVTLPITEGDGIPSSLYFTVIPTITYGTTVEIAYATVNRRFNEKSSRKIGRAFLKAVLKTTFSKSGDARTAYRDYCTFRDSQDETSARNALLKNDLPEHYRIAANLKIAKMSDDPAEICRICQDVIDSPYAMTQQKYEAAGLMTAARINDPGLPDWIGTMIREDLLADQAVDVLTAAGKDGLVPDIRFYSRAIYADIPREPGTY